MFTCRKVLIQGVSVSQDNVEQILQYAREQLHSLEHQLSGSLKKLLEQLSTWVSVVYIQN